jgi:hypothetical protein
LICHVARPLSKIGAAGVVAQRSVREIILNLISQLIWVTLAALSTVSLLFLFGTTDLREIIGAQVEVPAWLVLLVAIAVITGAALSFALQRRASVVRGRALATSGNLDLLRARRKVRLAARIVRSTRFGSWPPAEILEQRSEFRNELDLAIMKEGADVRRIWNVSTPGLDRVTMSLTTLDNTTFDALISSSRRLLDRTLAGLRSARRAGLTPLKINAVLYHSHQAGLGNLTEIRDLYEVAVQHGVDELRFFTLLWHETFARFDEFYHFFSPEMRAALESLLRHCHLVAPGEVVEILSALALRFAHRVYPKIEFGLELDQLRLGFEAMKYGRLPGDAGLQEGPYAMRLSADGALRATLNGPPSYELIRGVRQGRPFSELRSRYRAALEAMP